MRILIAEDELLERKAMRKFLEDNFKELGTIVEAANGREAIEQATVSAPDIIFMDIKMPGINGLEAIEKIQSMRPSSKFILVSAYDSFDFAKQAMHYGVKEYILKPGRKAEIVASILRVKKEIEFEREQLAEKRSLIEERLLTKLMQQAVDKEAYNLLREYFPDFQSGFFLVVQPDTSTEKDTVPDKLSRHLKHPCIVESTDERIICCMLANVELSKSAILMQARKLQLEFGESSLIGLGYPYKKPENLPKSYHEALTAVYQITKNHNRKYGFPEMVEEKDDRTGVATRLLAEIEKGNKREAVQFYTKSREFFSTDEHEELYFHVKRLLDAQNLSLPDGSITELNSDEEWQHFISLCCLKIREYYQSKKIAEKVKDYIDTHYKNGITLEEVAEHASLSPNYFSSVFKKEFGNTFVEYVTDKRMNEAKHLLMENKYSLKEICYMLGYNDPNYFSRVFKKHFRMSPKKYQQQIFKN